MIDIIDWEHNNILALELKDFWVVLLPTALLYSNFWTSDLGEGHVGLKVRISGTSIFWR